MKATCLILLGLAVFASAIANVFYQHQSRKLFVEIQQLETVRDGLDEEWGRLQLEQSTWATEERIEKIARDKLGMVEPDENTLVLFIR
jgi:cell division protein FtsL